MMANGVGKSNVGYFKVLKKIVGFNKFVAEF
jgi:hypothetical protein